MKLSKEKKKTDWESLYRIGRRHLLLEMQESWKSLVGGEGVSIILAHIYIKLY